MRRIWLLISLTALLGAAGLVCVLLGIQQAMGYPLLGSVLLMLAVVAGVVSSIQSHKDSMAIARQVINRARTGQPKRLVAPSRDVAPIADAVNDLFEEADRTVSDAQIKAKELEIQLKVATAERQHAEAIIYSISDAVLVTDPFDELVLANESAARALDFDLQTAERAPVEQILHDEKIISLIREMRQSKSTSGRRIVEHGVKTPAGERTYKITLSCVDGSRSDGAEGPAGVVAVLHDMTKEKEVAEMKNDFVSNVSHELRTPLASIKAYVEMLIDGEAEDPKTQGEFYEVIQGEANRLSRLIDNILNISRIESGLVKVNKQPQSLTVIMKEAIEVIAPQAKGKNITVKEELTPVFYQTVADRDMLYQAVLNLLSNAIKY
ncbi:MAG TPA: histidine kinase dimerization/phospho-acceptor domain-containing protein, partial [Tepidisphaeraceae bacterium]